MKVNIKIHFDDEEKRLLKKFPNDVTDDAVKLATHKGLEVINDHLTSFLNLVILYGYMSDKGGGIS